MKKFLYTLPLLFLGVFSQAQSAESILDAVSNHYENQKSFYIKFQSNLENKNTKTKGNYEGEIYVRGNKYNLTIPKMDLRQIYDGAKLYTISADNQEVTVSKPQKDSDEFLTPTKIFGIYKNGFSLNLEDKKGNVQYIKLIPRDKKELKYILIGVNTQNNQLLELKQVNDRNTTTTFKVIKEVEDVIIPRSLLNFDKKFYKDYYISEI